MSTNPIAVGRAFLYQQLSGDATLVALVSGRIYPDRPGQGTLFPYVYFEHIAGNSLRTINGFLVPWAMPLWRVHIYGDRDTNAEDLDPILNELIKQSGPLNRKSTTMVDGNQAGVVIEGDSPKWIPYDSNADRYPHYILECRVPVSFN